MAHIVSCEIWWFANVDIISWWVSGRSFHCYSFHTLVLRCVAYVIDSTGIYRWRKAKSSRRSILRASSSKWLWYDSKHSTTNLMYRTAKGISPSLMFQQRSSNVSPSRSSVLLFCSAIWFSLFFASSPSIIEARWKRTQFWSSKLAVIVELYDKPTLMVKVCPVFRQDAGTWVLHVPFAIIYPLFFFCLWKSSSDDVVFSKYSFAFSIFLS